MLVVGTKLLADPNTWCQLLCQKIQRNRFLFSKLKRDAITEATICSVWRFLGWPNYFWASNTIWRARGGLKICWSLPNNTEHFSAMTIFQMAGPEGEQICWSENLLIWAILLILGAAENLLIRQIWPIWARQTLKVVPLHNFCTKENWKWICPWSMKIALFSVLGRNGWGWAFFLSSNSSLLCLFLLLKMQWITGSGDNGDDGTLYLKGVKVSATYLIFVRNARNAVSVKVLAECKKIPEKKTRKLLLRANMS